MPEPESSRYRILFGGGVEKVITMPTAWKITFGPNVPGTRRTTYGGQSEWGWCFRVYSNTSPQKLKMCLPNVQEFYEEDVFQIEEIQRDEATRLVTERVTRRPTRPPNQVPFHWLDERLNIPQQERSNGNENMAGPEQM